MGLEKTSDDEIESSSGLLLWAAASNAQEYIKIKFSKQDEMRNKQLYVFRNQKCNHACCWRLYKDFIATVHKGKREHYTDNPVPL